MQRGRTLNINIKLPVSRKSLANIRDTIPHIAHGVLQVVRSAQNSQLAHILVTKRKEDHSVVTHVDHDNEQAILKLLRCYGVSGSLPLLTEEGTFTPDEDTELFWSIDSLDGTRDYATGRRDWGISLGLVHNATPVVGIIAQPSRPVLYGGSLLHRRTVLEHFAHAKDDSEFVSDNWREPSFNACLSRRAATSDAEWEFYKVLTKRFGYVKSSPTISSGIDVLSGKSLFYVAFNVHHWDIAALGVLAHVRKIPLMRLALGSIVWKPTRETLPPIVLARDTEILREVQNLWQEHIR
jgi:3'-phosphoadenosine 5'-phosphosulfate (PAPS) 3'-phosphatase